MAKFYLTLIFFTLSTAAMAQQYEKEYVTLFAYEVKHIDEFIDRFNDKDETLIKIYNKKHNPDKPLTREQLIKSLFNADNKNWNFSEVSTFINTVNSKTSPLYLNFFGDGWYAKLNCSIMWKGKPHTASLTVKLAEDNGYKWVITGVKAPFLQPPSAKNKMLIDSLTWPVAADTTALLDPESYSRDFFNIDKVATDKLNIANYFLKATTYNDDTPAFVRECLNGHLAIDKVNTITYFFTQVKGWQLEIKQFNRQTKNSGWLISSLKKTNNINEQ